MIKKKFVKFCNLKKNYRNPHLFTVNLPLQPMHLLKRGIVESKYIKGNFDIFLGQLKMETQPKKLGRGSNWYSV